MIFKKRKKEVVVTAKLTREDIYEFIRVTYPELNLLKLKPAVKTIQPMAFKHAPRKSDFIKTVKVSVKVGESISFEQLKSIFKAGNGGVSMSYTHAADEFTNNDDYHHCSCEKDFDDDWPDDIDWPTSDSFQETYAAVECITFAYDTGEDAYNVAKNEWNEYEAKRQRYNARIPVDQKNNHGVAEFNEAQIKMVKVSNPELWSATARQINLLRNANIKTGSST